MLLSDKLSEKTRDGIQMFWRKKNQFDDVTTSALMNKGIYSVQYPEEKESKWWIAWKEHNILTGMWYVFILSCLLWWLPVFGQMIAGYLGGRRAGSPTKGFMVAIIPVFIIMLLLVGMDMGALPFLVSIAQIPGIMLSGLQGISPSAASYLGGIFESLKPLVGLNGNGFLIVLVFAMIGGMMADMNRKEIQKATGNSQMFGGFSGMFSSASLSKFADMVAERVIWTMGTMETGGRTLIPTRHRQPKEIGFSDLQMLPASTSSYSPVSSWSEPEPNRSPQIYEYDNSHPEEEQFDEYQNLVIESVPLEPVPTRRITNDDDWGISHYDISEDSMTQNWIEHKKNMDSPKGRKRYGKTQKNRSKRLYDDRGERSPKVKEKRDATVFDGKGNEMDSTKPKKKAQPKKKQPSLVKRALEADKKIYPEPNKVQEITKPEPEDEAMDEILEKVTRPRPKPVASYERL
jgi:hypothetical protein